MKNLALAALVFTGCIPPPASGPGYAPQPGTEAAAAEPSPSEASGTTCVQIVQCLAGCGEDTACFPACIEQGDPDSQAAVGALLECNAAGDADCTPQLDTCRATGTAYAGGGAPAGGEVATTSYAMLPGQPHSTENLIPWLTGEWIGSRHQFVFYGDGRVRRSDGSGVTYGRPGTTADDKHCVSLVNDTGTVTQEGDLLIMVFEATDTNHCGEKTHTAGLTVRYRIDWFDNAYDNDPYLQLVLRDIDCTAGSMWCDDGMNRR